jgi:hypothetical protein
MMAYRTGLRDCLQGIVLELSLLSITIIYLQIGRMVVDGRLEVEWKMAIRLRQVTVVCQSSCV